MKKEIYDTGLGYYSFLKLTRFATRCHYSHITVRGKENLPEGESQILAPCHQQALMDPLVILEAMNRPVVFLARADVFAQPTVLKILTWLKMMPVYRIRDGKESLGKNNAIFNRCKEVLLHKMPLCLMAEGRHNDKHQLLPLVKGMFRIAGETQKALGEKQLYIVPMGLDFDEYEQTYPHVVVNIGKPIDIRPFMKDILEDEPVALNKMKEALTLALKQEMHHIESKEHYADIDSIGRIATLPIIKETRQFNNTWNRFETRRKITRKLDSLEQTAKDDTQAGQRLEHLLTLAEEYSKTCKRKGLMKAMTGRASDFMLWDLILVLLLALVLACFWHPWVLWGVLFSLICFPLTVIPTHLIARKMIKDPQFRSTANFGIRYGFSLVYTPILVITVLCYHGPLWALITLTSVFVMARLSGYINSAVRYCFLNFMVDLWALFHMKKFLKIERLEKELAKELKD